MDGAVATAAFHAPSPTYPPEPVEGNLTILGTAPSEQSSGAEHKGKGAL
jgi:hypothetical protein